MSELVAITAATPALTMDALAVQINEQIRLGEAAAAAQVEYAIRAGELLLEARSKCPHGTWTDWLIENCVVSPEWAQMYMRIARHQKLVRRRGFTTLKGARAYLTNHRSLPDTRVDPTLRAEAHRLRAQGATMREISAEIGVSQPTILRWVNPKSEEAYRRNKSKRSRQARMALRREERAALAARVGGEIGEGYSLIRRALDVLERAAADERDADARRAINSGMQSLYNAEDALARAMKLSSVAPRNEQSQ